MTSGDVEFAIQLTDLEDWGYTPEDFRRFMRMDPDGALVAWEGSRRIGVTVATLYGKVGWIGSIIVDPEARGKGNGKALLSEAIHYVEGHGGETCWLNAYVNTEKFYREFGFKAVGNTAHFEGKAVGVVEPEARLAHAGELEEISRFDSDYFGTDRGKVLRELYHDFGDSFFIWPEAGVTGYVVGGPHPGGVEIAPWVCDPARPEVAERLLNHLMSGHSGKSFGLNVPSENAVALRVLKSLGLREVFRTVRMYRGKGEGRIDPRGIFSLGGLEKG